jgi:uncharacterized repeat protein (TIGR01451 family)
MRRFAAEASCLSSRARSVVRAASHALVSRRLPLASRRVLLTTRRQLFAVRRLPLVIFALVAVALGAQSASAQNVIYQIRGTGDSDIYAYNISTNTRYDIYANYTGLNSAALAQRPSDGMLFYIINANGGDVYTFNPATPNIAPSRIGSIGATRPSSLRMAFSPVTDQLYYLPDTGRLYVIDQNNGNAADTGIDIAGLGSGGDMAFDSTGQLWVVNSSRQVFTASINADNTASGQGTLGITGSPATIGLAFGGNADTMYALGIDNYAVRVVTDSTTNPWTTSMVGASAAASATGDLASASVPAPNLSITKTDNKTSVYRGGPVQYIVTVTNNGTYAVTGTVTDNVPATITLTGNWTCVASAGSLCTAASGAGNNINTSAMLLPGGTATYTINGTVSATATGTLSNTASVAVPAWLTDSDTSDNTARDDDTINLNTNLSITKTDGLTTINPGATETYTITVTNNGPDVANGAIITDTVPASLSNITWTCVSLGGGATCGAASGSGNAISTTANLPNGRSVRYTVTGTLATNVPGTLSNTAQVAAPSGATDPTPANNSATDNTTINAVADPSITKTHTGNFTRGSIGTYTITVTNSGTGPTSGSVSFTDTLPAGLTPTAPTGLVNGWTCSIAGQVVSCTRNDALAATLSYPSINITVNVSQTAANSVTNTATVSGGGGNLLTSNDSASDPTTIVSSADLSLTKTVNNSAPTINANVTFTVTLSNAGATNATGVAAKDQLPAGLSFVSATPSAGTSYNSTSGVWTVGAMSSGASATLQIVAKVTASGTLTNTAQVTAANEPDPDSTPNNNNAAEDDQASATLNVPAPPQIQLVKSCTSPANCETAPQQPGTQLTYTITITNTGGSTAQGLTLIDIIPYTLAGTIYVNNVEFKVGSVTFNPNTSALVLPANGINYYKDSISTTPPPAPPWTPTQTYAPPGAVGTYDPLVTYVGWQFNGTLAPNTSASVTFTVRIK